jgi:hypothetical protein
MEDSMKRLSFLIITIILLVTLAGCNRNKGNEEEKSDTLSPTQGPVVTLKPEVSPGEDEIEESVGEEEKLTIEDYFPMEADTEYIYEGEGNEFASYRRYVDYIDVANKKLQTRTNNGGTETVRVLQIKDGALAVINIMNESYYRADFMNMAAGTDTEVLLMEPLVEGTKWVLKDGRQRSITGVKVPVTTPYGSFEALEVTTEADDSTTKDYYAAGVGLIKTLFQSEGLEVSSTLESVNKDATLMQQLTVYYADTDEKIYPVQKELSLRTGTDMISVLEEALKQEPPKTSYLPLISKNAKLNSITLQEGNVVHADFSRELVTEMNAGAGYELLILQALTNTLGNYYGSLEVLITLDGKPYESGHILMNEGETLPVDDKNVVQ